MRIVQWIIFGVSMIAVLVFGFAGLQVVQGKWHDPSGESALEFGQFSIRASRLIPLVLLLGAIGIFQVLVWGASPPDSYRPHQPVAAPSPTQGEVATRPDVPMPSASSEGTRRPKPPVTTPGPTVVTGPPWEQVTEGLDMVVERASWSANNPGRLDLAMRIENDSERNIDFSLPNFLAIDNSGIHYTADENRSNWGVGCCDSADLSSGQRIAGHIVLAQPLPRSVTSLIVSFNVQTESGSFADVNVVIPVPGVRG